MCRSPFSDQSKQSHVICSYPFGRILLSCTLSRERSIIPVVLFPRLCQFMFQLIYSWLCFWRYCFKLGSLVCMKVSGWKYIFSAGDCVSYTHSLMDWRVYCAPAIFNNCQETYVVARNPCSLLWKELFCEMEFKVQYSYEKITSSFNFRIISHACHCCS